MSITLILHPSHRPEEIVGYMPASTHANGWHLDLSSIPCDMCAGKGGAFHAFHEHASTLSPWIECTACDGTGTQE